VRRKDEDGLVVYESRAICRYLTAKYGMHTGLLPSTGDLKPYAKFEQAASIEYASFDPSAGGLIYERIMAKYSNNVFDCLSVYAYVDYV
jgi:glutathione S-transferase